MDLIYAFLGDLNLQSILVFSLIGIVAGVLSGVTGLGGGIIIVPALVAFFGTAALKDAIVISFFAVFINSIFATISKKNEYFLSSTGKVAWFKHIADSRVYILGTIFAALFISFIFGTHKDLIDKVYLAILQILLALAMLIDTKRISARLSANKYSDTIMGGIVGSLSTLIGVGGGTYTILYFNIAHNKEIKDCTVVSNFTGIFVGLMSIIGYFSSIAISKGPPTTIIGLAEAATVVAFGSIGAWYGAKYQKKIKSTNLKRTIVFVLAGSATYVLAPALHIATYYNHLEAYYLQTVSKIL